MKPFSVIITAHNMEAVIVRTLQSVEHALVFLHKHGPQQLGGEGEIVVVDDGSSDATWQRLSAFAADKPFYKLIRHSMSSSPSCARNIGVQASSGSLLFFLDGDDLFYPNHIAACLRAMEPGAGFAKSRVHIADPIHPDWIDSINYSIVINLCVRRQCHDAVGGFPDFLLCSREKGQLVPTTDIFYKFEDMYYNLLITKLFPGIAVNLETVENLRYPGNSFDRQYEKFCLPMGAYRKPQTELDNFRLALCDAIVAHRLYELRSTHRTDERGFLCGVF